MRMEVFTKKEAFGLGIVAKEIFASNVLDLDEDKNTFCIVQEYSNTTYEKLKKIPIDTGISLEKKRVY